MQSGDEDEPAGETGALRLGSKGFIYFFEELIRNGKKINKKTRQLLKFFVVDQAVRFLVSTLGFVVTLMLPLNFSGPPSTLNKGNSAEVSRYSLPLVHPSVLQAELCLPVDSPNSDLSSGSFSPLDFLANTTYHPSDVCESSHPNISNLPWLLLACLIVGLVCLGAPVIISAYTSSPPLTYSAELLRYKFDGEVPLTNSDSPAGTFSCLNIVLLTILSSHHIIRGYGVAIWALTSLESSSATCLAAQMRATHTI